ncbi:ketoacyl-ACP synthase III family protein [Streptomyces sp. CA2R101]|uniref:ketoacyl-ACP synthase III family protein n=1 Tax=Streptomyces sp. CA2R101 TaxID=3120152 RepID=UPI00300B1C2D
MITDGLCIAGTGVRLPPAMNCAEAVERRLCEQGLVESTGMLSVTVSEDESGPEMAAAAGAAALAASGLRPDDIRLVLHASIYYQGHELWAPASFVHRRVVGTDCPAMEVRQVSNGGMAGVELAAAYLAGNDRPGAALVTTGDRFCPPGFDRWRSDPGTVYGDGGTALVLSRLGGFARFRSLVSVSAPELEGMHRGDDPFDRVPFESRPVVDLDANKKAFVADPEAKARAIARTGACQREVIDRALARAGVELSDVDQVVLPHLGWRRLRAGYLSRMGIPVERTTWPWSRTVGHLGAGDPFAGFDHVLRTRRPGPGTLCLLTSVGAGFSWSAAVVEITGEPTLPEKG